MSDLLGIYIPTRNRPIELMESLSSIIPQIRRYSFPIYISDNSTNSETEKLVKKLKRAYFRIYYKRNDLRDGTYASNLISAMRMGHTKFIWFFSDDDALEEGAIDTVVKELSRGFSFLLTVVMPYSRDLKNPYPDQTFPKADSDIVYEKGKHNDVLLKANLGFLGGAIVMKKRLDKAIHNNLSISRSGIILNRTGQPTEPSFTHFFCYLAVPGLKGKLIAKPLIKLRRGNNAFENSYLKEYFKDKYEAIDNLRGIYSGEACDQVMRLSMQAAAMMAMTAKLMQPHKTEENKEIVIEDKHISPGMRIIFVLLLSVPVPVYKLIRTTLHLTKGRNW